MSQEKLGSLFDPTGLAYLSTDRRHCQNTQTDTGAILAIDHSDRDSKRFGFDALFDPEAVHPRACIPAAQ